MKLKKIISILALTLATTSAFAADHMGCLKTADQRILKWTTVTSPQQKVILDLEQCMIMDVDADAIASYLAQHPQINGIYLDNSSLSAESVGKILKSSQLTFVSMPDCRLKDDSAKVIAQHPEISELILSGNYFSSKGVAHIASLPNLIALSLVGNGMVPTFTDVDAKILAKRSSLEWLDLGNNEIGSDGAKALAQLPNLKLLSLEYNNIRDDGAAAFAKSHVPYFYLAGNHIGNQGAVALASASIEQLYLAHNDIEDVGAKALVHSPAYSLDVSFNRIGVPGVIALENREQGADVTGNDGNSNHPRIFTKKVAADKVSQYAQFMCKNKTNSICRDMNQ